MPAMGLVCGGLRASCVTPTCGLICEQQCGVDQRLFCFSGLVWTLWSQVVRSHTLRDEIGVMGETERGREETCTRTPS